MRYVFSLIASLALAAPAAAQLPEGTLDIEARAGIVLRGAEEVIIAGATPDGDIAIAKANGEMLATLPGGVAGRPGAFCLWRPSREQILYAYLGSDQGEIAHHVLLFDQQNEGGGEAVTDYQNRMIAVSGPVTACAVDEPRGQLYVAVTGDGIRRFAADVPRDEELGVSIGSLLNMMRGLADPAQTGGEQVLAESDLGWRAERLVVIEGPSGDRVLLLGGEDGQSRAVPLSEADEQPDG